MLLPIVTSKSDLSNGAIGLRRGRFLRLDMECKESGRQNSFLHDERLAIRYTDCGFPIRFPARRQLSDRFPTDERLAFRYTSAVQTAVGPLRFHFPHAKVARTASRIGGKLSDSFPPGGKLSDSFPPVSGFFAKLL